MDRIHEKSAIHRRSGAPVKRAILVLGAMGFAFAFVHALRARSAHTR